MDTKYLIKTVSALDKCFLLDSIDSKKVYDDGSVVSGEVFSFHVIFTAGENVPSKTRCRARYTCCSEDEAESNFDVKLFSIENVPVRMPCYPDSFDENYISREPGLYPDLLLPLSESSEVYIIKGQMSSIRVEISIPSGTPSGKYRADVFLISRDDGSEVCRTSINFEVIGAELPRQDTVVMNWLHADCISNYYSVPPMSDQHFDYIDKFVECAVRNGINALYTPVFTPPLDTEPFGERTTIQLVDVSRCGGEWSFGFDKLDRWCDMALKRGVEYFEISHLFTQWGARHAPKIIGYENGEYKRFFGWETDSLSDEYKSFLRRFLKEFIAHMKGLGLDKRCIFHVSDEPRAEDIENYRAVKENISDILDGYIVADALSDIAFYKEGLCKNPIPGCDHMEPFLELIPKNLWTYYCCSQSVKVSNRFIAMSLSRTRIIGVQMWKFNVTGFLQWGYNFYSSQFSTHPINPFLCTDGDYFSPSGDCFSVYPGPDGTPYESLRIRAFAEALSDIRTLRAAEMKHGRKAVLEAVEKDLGYEITFIKYPHDEEYLLSMRKRINDMLK